MYSIDKEALEKQQKYLEVDVHPITKWKRFLLYLGDLMISFITAVLLLTVVVMPIASTFIKTDSDKTVAAEHIRDDVLYDNKLMHYSGTEEDAEFPKYNLNKNLEYTFNRFLAYYMFVEEENPYLSPSYKYPEYTHRNDNEPIKHYFVELYDREATYIDYFYGHEQSYGYFDYNYDGDNRTTPLKIKDEMRIELLPFFDPNDSLGKKGQSYYNNLSDLYAALFGMVIKDIKSIDLHDNHGNSFIENQRIIDEISNRFYLTIAICCLISYVIAWGLTYLMYPLLNSGGRTITMSIMKIDRLGMNNLMPLSKGEIAFTGVHSLMFNIVYISFLSLSYTSFIFSLAVPILPFLSFFGFVVCLISFMFLLFNDYSRTLTDILSRTVLVPSEDVDGIIKAKETLLEIQNAERKQKQK